MPSRRIKFNDLLVKIVADDKLTKVMKRVQKLIKGTTAIAAKTTAALTAIGTAGFGVLTSRSADFAASIAKTSAQLGLGTDRFQEYFNAAKFADSSIDVNEFGDALKDVVERVTEANTLGEGDLFDSAKAAGLNTTLTKSGDIIADVVFKFGQLNEEDRLFRTRELVGDSGFEQLSGLMSLSTERLQALIAESRKLGLIITPENLKNISEARRGIGVLKQLMTTLGVEIAAKLAPKLVDLTIFVTEFVKANGGVAQFLESVFDRITLKISQLRVAVDELPFIDLDLSSAEQDLKRYQDLQKSVKQTTKDLAEETILLNNSTGNRFGIFSEASIKANEDAVDRTRALLDIQKRQLADIDLPVSPDFEFKVPTLSREDIDRQREALFGSFNSTRPIKAPVNIQPDIIVDTAKVEQNLGPLKDALTEGMQAAARDVSAALGPAFGPAVASLLESSVTQVGMAAGEEAANATAAGFNAAIGNLSVQALDVDRILSAEELCQKAEKTGERAATCLDNAFATKLDEVQAAAGALGNVLGGIEGLFAANEQNEIDRLNRAKARNASEIDILKSRLESSKNLSRGEIGLYNQQVASLNNRNRSIDRAAAAAEQKACKRAKKFAVLQGAIAVASAWAAAAKAGAQGAIAGPIGYFAAFAPVLAAGLGAAANIAKFDCNKIGSTSGGGGGGGGSSAGGGATGAAGGVQNQRAGADLQSFDFSRGGPDKIINLTLVGDNFGPDQITDIVTKINEGDAQINADKVAGVF